MIDILLPAFLVSLVLLGIHSYFGLHIIRRNIIFTDLAIGQMAALGAAFSLLLFHGENIYLFSLTLALAGALLISFQAKRSDHPEAVIGLLYALGLSGVFILLSRSPHGMENFQNLMAYDIIFTAMDDIWPVAALYAATGMVLHISGKRFSGTRNDAIFFLCFAVTVTSSVKMAGVLVVFALLLAPAFITIQLGKRYSGSIFESQPLLSSWGTGIVINMLAILVSYYGDFPTGYTLVLCNSLAATTASFIPVRGSEAR